MKKVIQLPNGREARLIKEYPGGGGEYQIYLNGKPDPNWFQPKMSKGK